MNEIKIVLQGGLIGCCTQYTTSQMKMFTKKLVYGNRKF